MEINYDNVRFVVQNLRLDDVFRAYIGRKVGCMCGCNGEYYAPSSRFMDDNILGKLDEKKVLKALRLVQAAYAEMTDEDISDHTNFDKDGNPFIFECLVGREPYVIYLHDW